jgi:hypothetical protein
MLRYLYQALNDSDDSDEIIDIVNLSNDIARRQQSY